MEANIGRVYRKSVTKKGKKFFIFRIPSFSYTFSMKTIAIIGAWASGLMTAVTILENNQNDNYHIHIFEKNLTPGKKVIISWGGRCNVTTGITDKKELLSRYTRGAEFIKPALGKFSPKKCREWFESHSIPLKCEADKRVFPVSDNGRDIVWVFEKVFLLYKGKITIHYGEWVSDVDSQNEWFQIKTEKWVYLANILVITTGGNAYSHTGSSGDGYAFARKLGHNITTLWPSLSSFLTTDEWMKICSGTSFEKGNISFEVHGKNQSFSWWILLTHFGISGPLTFRVSSHLAFELIDKNHPRKILFAPIADIKKEDWEQFLKNEFATHPKKTLINILTSQLSRKFAESFCNHFFSHLEGVFSGSISRNDREKVSNLLGNGIPISLVERRPGDEFVTAGWVLTDEISEETFESKIKKNLYFAGEILDVDGVTWGFSLQICWSSGYSAGKDIAKKITLQ